MVMVPGPGVVSHIFPFDYAIEEHAAEFRQITLMQSLITMGETPFWSWFLTRFYSGAERSILFLFRSRSTLKV
jgi:hypothetical protein